MTWNFRTDTRISRFFSE